VVVACLWARSCYRQSNAKHHLAHRAAKQCRQIPREHFVQKKLQNVRPIRELREKEQERKEGLIKRGLCPNCESSIFTKKMSYEGEDRFRLQKSRDIKEFICGKCGRLFKKKEKAFYTDGSSSSWVEEYMDWDRDIMR